MSSWSNGSLDPVTFCDKITDFLLEHPSPDGSVQPKQPQSDIKKKVRNLTILALILLAAYTFL